MARLSSVPTLGVGVGSKRFHRIEEGDAFFSGEDAIAVARPDDADRFGSDLFTTCVADRLANVDFLRYYFLNDTRLKEILVSSPWGHWPQPHARRGEADGQGRIYPTLSVQQTPAAIRRTNAALVPATLERLFSPAA